MNFYMNYFFKFVEKHMNMSLARPSSSAMFMGMLDNKSSFTNERPSSSSALKTVLGKFRLKLRP